MCSRRKHVKILPVGTNRMRNLYEHVMLTRRDKAPTLFWTCHRFLVSLEFGGTALNLPTPLPLLGFGQLVL